MKLALLGGQDPTTESWTQEVEAAVSASFTGTAVQRYLHWLDPYDHPLMDVEAEATRLAQTVEGWEKYAIFAKSAGTWITLRAIKDGLIQPSWCVFVGTAINFGRANQIPVDTWLQDYRTPTRFVQNEEDPAIGSRELQSLLDLRNTSNCSVVEIRGNTTHHYEDVDYIGQLVTQFAAEQS